jgi:hypothetical protein
MKCPYPVCDKQTKSSAEQAKSSANEIRIMLNSITKDAALEKEAAVEDAKKTKDQEWELKMKEMVRAARLCGRDLNLRY